MPASRLVNRNVIAARGRTSMRLEPELWEALAEACAREGLSASQLCRRAEAAMPGAPRTSAIRVFLINYYRSAADEAGHVRAGHGILAPNWRARFAEAEGQAEAQANAQVNVRALAQIAAPAQMQQAQMQQAQMQQAQMQQAQMQQAQMQQAQMQQIRPQPGPLLAGTGSSAAAAANGHAVAAGGASLAHAAPVAAAPAPAAILAGAGAQTGLPGPALASRPQPAAQPAPVAPTAGPSAAIAAPAAPRPMLGLRPVPTTPRAAAE